MRRTVLQALLCPFFAAIPLLSQESVCLKTGFCIDAESHMLSDGMLVIQRGKGTLEFPVDQVDSITALPLSRVSSVPALRPVSTPQFGSAEILIRAALQQGLEPEFVRSVAMIESGLHQEVVSDKGAIGIMQLMPLTASQLGVDPLKIEQNALGGAAFLRRLLIKYDGNSALALAAYNAGPAAVDKYRGIPPFPETRRYVVKVLNEYSRQLHQQSEKSLQAEKTAPAQNSPAPVALRAQTAKPKAIEHVTVQQ